MVAPRFEALLARMRPEQMRVYQVAMLLAAEADRILEGLPFRVKDIAYHLERSMNSVSFNLMEGLTAFRPAVKAHAFDITRKEASEVKMAFRRLVMRKARTSADVARGIELADCLIGMLTAMIKQQEARM